MRALRGKISKAQILDSRRNFARLCVGEDALELEESSARGVGIFLEDCFGTSWTGGSTTKFWVPSIAVDGSSTTISLAMVASLSGTVTSKSSLVGPESWMKVVVRGTEGPEEG